MALFTRVTKTRVWGTKGNVSFLRFINYEKEKSITISVLGEDRKKHSITIYGLEIERLEYILNKKQKT